MNIGLVRTVTAGGTVGQRRIVVPHASNPGEFIEATSATTALMGVCVQPGGATAGQPMDIQLDGIAEVIAGGTIAAGAPVTANASGAAVTASPGAGVNNRLIGFAFEAAVSGDIFRVRLAPGSIQG
jgi:hypothetical protein